MITYKLNLFYSQGWDNNSIYKEHSDCIGRQNKLITIQFHNSVIFHTYEIEKAETDCTIIRSSHILENK